ncbi:unnamed protein product, partial [Didymodactylos carnosus]
QNVLIGGWDGFKNTHKNTRTYSITAKNKFMTIVVGSTGEKFNDLLEYYSKTNNTSGLRERFTIIAYPGYHDYQLCLKYIKNGRLPALQSIDTTMHVERQSESPQQTAIYVRSYQTCWRKASSLEQIFLALRLLGELHQQNPTLKEQSLNKNFILEMKQIVDTQLHALPNPINITTSTADTVPPKKKIQLYLLAHQHSK